MKLLSFLSMVFAVVQSASACGRIYGAMNNYLAADTYTTTMFDGCQDRCKGTSTGFGWSYDSVIDMPCNSVYELQMTHNGNEAYYSTPHGKYDLKFRAKFSKVVCGAIKDTILVHCTTYANNCWAFTNGCNGCGGYQSGSSPKCSSNNGLRKRGLLKSSDDNMDPNPAWVYNKTIVLDMVKNGTLKLQGLALEVYNHNEQLKNGGSSKLQSGSSFNTTAFHDKYFGST